MLIPEILSLTGFVIILNSAVTFYLRFYAENSKYVKLSFMHMYKHLHIIFVNFF